MWLWWLGFQMTTENPLGLQETHRLGWKTSHKPSPLLPLHTGIFSCWQWCPRCPSGPQISFQKLCNFWTAPGPHALGFDPRHICRSPSPFQTEQKKQEFRKWRESAVVDTDNFSLVAYSGVPKKPPSCLFYGTNCFQNLAIFQPLNWKWGGGGYWKKNKPGVLIGFP